MKRFFFIMMTIGVAMFCNAQKKRPPVTKFKPPVIVKKSERLDSPDRVKVKFKPPVIKKDQPVKGKKQIKGEAVRFKPPVIVKDAPKGN